MGEVSFQTAFESVMSSDNLFRAIHASVYILVNTALSECLTSCAVNDSLHFASYVGELLFSIMNINNVEIVIGGK